MFRYHYPDLAKTISNSNGMNSMLGFRETGLYWVAKILRLFRLNSLMPVSHRHTPFEFNYPAFAFSKEKSVYPLMTEKQNIADYLGLFGGQSYIKDIYEKATRGSVHDYHKLLTLQSISWSLKTALEGDVH